MRLIATGLSVAIAAVCGAAIGVLFTVAHRATVELGPIAFPYGIVLGILSVGAFVAAMRLLWDTRWPAVGSAVGLATAVLALSFGGDRQDILVRDDALGWTWLIAPLVLALVIVAWPRMVLRRRAVAPRHAGSEATIEGPEEPAEERS